MISRELVFTIFVHFPRFTWPDLEGPVDQVSGRCVTIVSSGPRTKNLKCVTKRKAGTLSQKRPILVVPAPFVLTRTGSCEASLETLEPIISGLRFHMEMEIPIKTD